ncbi:alpha-ketoglutarate-dependent dioxygenase AlkB [Aliiroseovarius subalbicans]|uniref:alpha-ketoglutarate-dependent dioxygenase AlkB family protein n=1 Tax=Aliiroseovarius subalbicans TaxID=2925840 RepID=UPI001F57441E|nr:alpha-ketoglutarate-dependent dioxygenase AlkB [Aliiroseovarius subalbicans]MCI2400106.1 alpha-ketoglutarate-dependent dioxygenase AlkB [Aliiroseovarius subalbicans]
MNGVFGKPNVMLGGASVWKGLVDGPAQVAMIDALRDVVAAAPLFRPRTRWGKEMSVRMTSCGRYGWYSDARGYRYVDTHPAGGAWPDIPDCIVALWHQVTGLERRPDCCLINLYSEGARMGLHQDRDEADFSFPVLSVSLGDDGLFRIGGDKKGGATQSLWLASGDVLMLGGASRLAYHGVDRIRFGSSSLLSGGGRINLTMRVVD